MGQDSAVARVLPAARVIHALDELVEVRGAPLSIRLANGLEFIADALAQWAQSKGIALNHIQPGKPTQSAFVARFNKTYRTGVLDCYVFDSLHEAEDWLHPPWLCWPPFDGRRNRK